MCGKFILFAITYVIFALIIERLTNSSAWELLADVLTANWIYSEKMKIFNLQILKGIIIGCMSNAMIPLFRLEKLKVQKIIAITYMIGINIIIFLLVLAKYPLVQIVPPLLTILLLIYLLIIRDE